jgi:hypothetical protein
MNYRVDMLNRIMSFYCLDKNDLEQFFAADIFKFRIFIGKPVADISRAQGAEKGVRNRVQERVAVGVAQRPPAGRNPYTPQVKFSSLDQTMRVTAEAGAIL